MPVIVSKYSDVNVAVFKKAVSDLIVFNLLEKIFYIQLLSFAVTLGPKGKRERGNLGPVEGVLNNYMF